MFTLPRLSDTIVRVCKSVGSLLDQEPLVKSTPTTCVQRIEDVGPQLRVHFSLLPTPARPLILQAGKTALEGKLTIQRSKLNRLRLSANQIPKSACQRCSVLLEKFPSLLEDVSWVSLCNAPTPLQKLHRLGPKAWVKRDDLLHEQYGGNKIRKFEFILGDVLLLASDAIFTVGGSGTNQGTALSVIGKQLGLHVLVATFSQEQTPSTMKNKALMRENNVSTFSASDVKQAFACYALHHMVHRESTYLLEGGATNRASTLGYVNAALELQEQISNGLAPAPDRVVVAMGTQGTAVGLALGLAIAGLKCKVTAMVVYEPSEMLSSREEYERQATNLLQSTYDLLHVHGCEIPSSNWPELEICYDYIGKGYGVPSEEGTYACKLGKSFGLQLDPCYTGKAFAAFIQRCQTTDEVVLFWNTYSSTHLCGRESVHSCNTSAPY